MAGFIYALISLMIGSYQVFSFENGMHSKLYTQDKENFRRVYYPEDQYQKELEDVILGRKPLEFSYMEYISTYYLAFCCCCGIKDRDWYKKRKQRVDMYEQASDRLSGEIDILDFI